MLDSPSSKKWLALGSISGERESSVAAQGLPGEGCTFWVRMELFHRDSTLARALVKGLVCPGFSRYLLLEDTIIPQTLSSGFISLSQVHFTAATFPAFSTKGWKKKEEQNKRFGAESKKVGEREKLSCFWIEGIETILRQFRNVILGHGYWLSSNKDEHRNFWDFTMYR